MKMQMGCSRNGAVKPAGVEGSPSPLARIEDALDDIKAGKMIILVDDEDRENEGDLTIAADHVIPDLVNFMDSLVS